MKFGPLPPKKIPQQDSAKVLKLAERWQRAAFAHEKWATPAKEAVDMVEGRQWTEKQLAEMKKSGRLALTFNILAPIVRLVLGYQRNNRADITFVPGQDTRSAEQVADALTAIEKSIANACRMEYVDTEVFLDGLISARGWFDSRLDFEENDLGEVKTIALDPFTVFVDPEADTYDINASASYMQVAKYVSIDEIEDACGKTVAELVRPYTMGQTPLAPMSSLIVNDEVTPVRYFGAREEGGTEYWDQFYSLAGDFVDRHRKTIRIIETQYKVREPANVMIDLETGDKVVLPDSWGPDRVQKALLYAQMVNNPCVVQKRMVERLHWTTMVGDVIIYDAPSPYKHYTMAGFFPYFRRGIARGMVEDLIDPQKEKNKRRSAEIEIVSKTANGGWKVHEDSLDPVQEANLKKFGSRPGVVVKWKGQHEPAQIEPNAPPMAHERLENKADEDIRRISGVNESALGENDISGQSGKAIEARQRQAVISVQMYMDNFKRTKQLVGDQHLSIIQRYYTEPRIYRVTGDDGVQDQAAINQVMNDPLSGAKSILNNVTVGKYVAVVDDAPLSATFAAGQWEEMMTLLDKLGPVLGGALPQFADLIVGASSLPKKQEWLDRLKTMMEQKQQAPQAPPPPPPKESINFKDLPPEGQAQMASQVGIQLDPQVYANHQAAQQQPAAPPAGNVVPMAVGQ